MTRRGLAAIVLAFTGACVSACRAPAAAGPELHITADEYGYRMPDSVAAGLVHITLRNAGADLHEALLVRFTDTTGTAAAYADSVRAHVDFPSNAEDVGGAALTMPGDSSGVWLELAPGHYAVICWKGDHLVRGMAHDLWVVPSREVPRAPPRATRRLTLADFAFRLDTPFTAGRHVLHVRNAGTEAHEADIFRATSTAGLREYLAWIDSGSHGLPPAEPVAGFGDLHPGREAWVELGLTPGRYFIVCQVQAKADGRPHYERGMFAEFSIDSSRPLREARPPRRSARVRAMRIPNTRAALAPPLRSPSPRSEPRLVRDDGSAPARRAAAAVADRCRPWTSRTCRPRSAGADERSPESRSHSPSAPTRPACGPAGAFAGPRAFFP